MIQTTYPQMHIHLGNLRHNYRVVAQRVQPAQVACVVKDNAYGLGAQQVVKALLEEGARHFCVAWADEGKIIRQLSPDAQIYVLQEIGTDTLEIVRQYHLTPVISSLPTWQSWKQQNIQDIRPALFVETGLNRLGLRPQDVAQLTPEDKTGVQWCFSHLACSDEAEHPLNQQQLSAFNQQKQHFPQAQASLAQSAGSLLGKDYTFDLVRVGALLYGIQAPKDLDIKPVMSIQAPILQTAIVPAGQSVSYGATYTAPTERKIAVLAFGYGNGMFRSLSNVGRVYIQGKAAPILGRICMDNLMCDITDIPDVQAGDMADILNDVYTADRMAHDADTIPYEVLVRFGQGSSFQRFWD